MTDTGCDLSSAPCSISAVGLTATSVSAGTSSAVCDQANYGGNVSYSACTNGAAVTVTTPCTPASPCAAQTVVGSTAQTAAINSGVSGSITCNAPNYSGATVNYTCSNGSLTPTPSCANSCATNYTGTTCGSCSGNYSLSSGCTTCNTGYTGAGCTSCDTGYQSVSGVCTRITCSVAAANGFAAQSGLDYASSVTAIPSSPCQSGYTASSSPAPSYTCTAIGAAASLSGTCAAGPCTVTGTVTTDTTNRCHIFTGNGTINCTVSRSVDILVVAAGGAGGAHSSSSNTGGGGGVVYVTGYPIPAGITFNATVAGTTAGQNGMYGLTGGDSTLISASNLSNPTSIGNVTAKGGGGGGGNGRGQATGGSSSGLAGCGYGYSPNTNNTVAVTASTVTTHFATAGAAVSIKGNKGGYSMCPDNTGGGGGGGANAVGGDAYGTTGGNGNTASYTGAGGNGGGGFTVFGSTYGSGGGGGSGTGYYGAGGTNAGNAGATGASKNAVSNTGSGGGACSLCSTAGGSGGSGVIIVRY